MLRRRERIRAGGTLAFDSADEQIDAIQPDWELVQSLAGTSTNDFGIERAPRGDGADGTALPSGFTVGPGDEGGLQQFALAPNGSVVGSDLSTSQPEIWLPSGTVQPLPLPVPSTGKADAINSAGQIVGEVGGLAAVWPTSSSLPINLNTLIPTNSGWVLKNAFAISADGEILGTGSFEGSSHYFVLDYSTQYAVSGSVQSVGCTDAACNAPAGLPGVTMLVTGTTHAGAPLSVSATTASDGSWSVNVPSGSYTAGPSVDGGNTVDGTGFDPNSTQVTVSSVAVPDIDFTGCTPPESSLEASADPAVLAHASRDAASAAAAGFSPSLCKSLYTLTLSAKIPQAVLVDPSLDGHYNRSSVSGHVEFESNPLEAWLRVLHTPAFIVHLLPHALEYPECMSDNLVKKLTEQDVEAEWATHIVGGSLGSVSVPFIWNQTTQGVHVYAAPTVTTAKMTRVFEYELLYPKHHVKHGSCSETLQVPVLTAPIGGDDKTGSAMPTNQFSWVTAWLFPLDVAGAKIDVQNSPTLRAFVARHCKACDEWYAGYEHSHSAAKAIFELTVGYGLGTGEVEGILKGAAKASAALDEAKWLPGVLAELKEALEVRHKLGSVHELYEAYDTLAGLEGYPVMATVIRGRFHTIPETYGGAPVVINNNTVVAGTTLALSAVTSFPTVGLSITRSAYGATASSGSSSGKVFNGPLPWNGPFGSLVSTYNPTFGSLGTNVISDTATDGKSYGGGERAVENVLHDTAANGPIAQALKLGTLFPSAAAFNAEQDIAPVPGCDPTSFQPTTSDTICWTFEDQRPEKGRSLPVGPVRSASTPPGEPLTTPEDATPGSLCQPGSVREPPRVHRRGHEIRNAARGGTDDGVPCIGDRGGISADAGNAPCSARKGGIYLSQVELRQGLWLGEAVGERIGGDGRARPGCGLTIRLR